MWIGGQWFVVIGILERAPLAPEIDGVGAHRVSGRRRALRTTTSPSTLYVRIGAGSGRGGARRAGPRRSDPDAPGEVDVSRPSDALEARATTDAALRNLLLALGAVALVVGGVGITNVMVISVLERRSEIGVRRGPRRPPGPRRRPVPRRGRRARRCSAESAAPPSAPLVTAFYARSQGWLVEVPALALTGAAAAALAVGLLAGVSPAVRAARLDPADAVRPH